MPSPVVALAAGTIGSSILGSNAQKKAANKAADAQTQAAQMGVDEEQRQFDALKELLAPYAQAGYGSLGAQQNLLGLNGNGAQSEAINALMNGAQFNALAKQGEDAILQNAAATGGLRGGNTQAALAQFRPAMLNQLIQQQYGNLAGITSMGQNAAAMTGNAGMQSAGAISNLYEQMGAAKAGNAMAKGQADASLYNLPMQLMGTYLGGGGKF